MNYLLISQRSSADGAIARAIPKRSPLIVG